MLSSLEFYHQSANEKALQANGALVSQSLEARIYVFNYLPLVLRRLDDASVLGASHSTDTLTNKPLRYLPLG